MALTPEQILEFRRRNGIPDEGYGSVENALKATGSTSSGPTTSSGGDWYEGVKAKWAEENKKKEEATKKRAFDAETENVEGPLGFAQGLAKDAFGTLIAKPATRLAQAAGTGIGMAAEGIGEAIGNEDVEQYGKDVQERANKDLNVPTPFGKVRVEKQKDIDKGGVRQIASDVAKSASYLAPIPAVGGAVGKVVGGKILPAAAQGALGGAIGGGFTGLGEGLADENKSAAGVATDTAIGAGIGAATGGALGAAGAGVSKLGQGVKNKFFPTPEQKLEIATSAINPKLKGKTTIDAYKQIVTGKREVTPAGFGVKQDVTPTPQVKELGERLQDVITNESPVDNLKALSRELDATESKLISELEGDPTLIFNAQKPELASKIEEVKSQMPREFASIRESKRTFNDVADFAKELLEEADDNIIGLRNVRTAFDAQAQLEYPNAYKEGHIDIKTPAGRAIKAIRDLINDHLYETAPNGSTIKELIRREADIFRATDFIAPKAAELHGKTQIQHLLKELFSHPIVLGGTALATLGAGIAGVGAVVNAASGGEGSK